MNVLAVGAHHDDFELGCGGTLARLSGAGHRIWGITLTDSETHDQLQNIHRTRAQAKSEAARAARALGVALLEPGFAPARNGELVYGVDAMRALEKVIYSRKVDVLFCHWLYDLNTDHRAAAQLCIVAARRVPTVLMYRSNWHLTGRTFHGVCMVDVSGSIAKKRKSLACYRVEIANRGRAWIDSFIDFNRSLGHGIGVRYAEAFQPVRQVWSP
jgi:LmbE family N-acetylglucosaminyl deacetylase